MKLLSILRLLVVLAVVGVIAYVAWLWHSSEEAERLHSFDATIRQVEAMARISAIELYDDIPIKANIGTRHLFARQTLTGSISFDLEKMRIEEQGDTIVVTLPPEIIEVYESTEPGSYQVVDTWNTKFLGSTQFSTAEENAIKRRVIENYRQSLYQRGIVSKARTQAAANIHALLTATTSRPVLIRP